MTLDNDENNKNNNNNNDKNPTTNSIKVLKLFMHQNTKLLGCVCKHLVLVYNDHEGQCEPKLSDPTGHTELLPEAALDALDVYYNAAGRKDLLFL